MNKKQKDKFINLILVLIAVILIMLNIILVLRIINKNNTNETEKNETNVENVEKTEENDAVIEEKDVKSMNEKERMVYYINQFIDEIENKNYSKAYGYLNKEFKENYFDTEEKFKNYIQENLNPDTLVMNFQNIERLGNPINGNIYVVWMEVGNIFEINSEEEKEDTTFVILEKDYDDFELSFKVFKR